MIDQDRCWAWVLGYDCRLVRCEASERSEAVNDSDEFKLSLVPTSADNMIGLGVICNTSQGGAQEANKATRLGLEARGNIKSDKAGSDSRRTGRWIKIRRE